VALELMMGQYSSRAAVGNKSNENEKTTKTKQKQSKNKTADCWKGKEARCY